MLGKIFIRTWLLLALLVSSAQAAGTLLHDDILMGDGLPTGVVNTALAQFGLSHLGGNYGPGNVIPVEVVGQGNRREVRIFRTPSINFLHRTSANMQVLLGDLRGIYIWVETPPVQGDWRLSVDRLEMDGTRTPLYSAQLNPGSRYYVNVIPHTRLDVRISTKTTAIKYNRIFVLTVSPWDIWARWPQYMPVPYRTIF